MKFIYIMTQQTQTLSTHNVNAGTGKVQWWWWFCDSESTTRAFAMVQVSLTVSPFATILLAVHPLCRYPVHHQRQKWANREKEEEKKLWRRKQSRIYPLQRHGDFGFGYLQRSKMRLLYFDLFVPFCVLYLLLIYPPIFLLLFHYSPSFDFFLFLFRILL